MHRTIPPTFTSYEEYEEDRVDKPQTHPNIKPEGQFPKPTLELLGPWGSWAVRALHHGSSPYPQHSNFPIAGENLLFRPPSISPAGPLGGVVQIAW